MSDMTQTIAHQLKAMNFPAERQRALRAGALARTLAYEIPIVPGETAETTANKYQELFLDVINAVNETIPVDTRLTRALFKRFLEARCDVVNRSTSPVLVQAILASGQQAAELDDDDKETLRGLLDHEEANAPQRRLSQQIKGLFEQRYPEHDED